MSDDIMEYLLFHARNLVKLLEDPQLGLFSWHESVLRTLRALSEYKKNGKA